MSEEAGAAPTAASAAGAVADSTTMADAPPGVETAEEEPVDAEPPAATGATATAAPQQREADKTAAELVAAENKLNGGASSRGLGGSHPQRAIDGAPWHRGKES